MTVNLVQNCDLTAEPAAGDGRETPLPASLARLPVDLQPALIAMSAAGRGLFGHGHTQAIFDANLVVLERLYDLGASHRDVAEILHAIGITRADGERLDAGTVSSCLSRARGAAARKPSGRRTADRRNYKLWPGAANSAAAEGLGVPLRTVVPATVTPLHASSVTEPGPPARSADELWSGEARHSRDQAGPLSEPRGSSPPPRAMADGDDNTIASRKAGDLLNRLRKNDDE